MKAYNSRNPFLTPFNIYLIKPQKVLLSKDTLSPKNITWSITFQMPRLRVCANLFEQLASRYRILIKLSDLIKANIFLIQRCFAH